LAFISVLFLPDMKTVDNLPDNIVDAMMKFFNRIGEGYGYIRHNKSILMPFLLLLALQVTLAVVVVNVPFFATEIFKIEVSQTGLFMVVPGGIGAICGALIIPRILKRGIRKITVIYNSLMVVSLSFLLFSFLIPSLEGAFRLVTGMFLLALLGISFVGITVPAQTFLQEKTPGGMRGRVFGNFWFLVIIATVLPVIASGTITEILGIRFLLFTFFIVSLGGIFVMKNYGDQFINEGNGK
jgi:MFS-type transporter involved in bile tolerance (Atg22 family)